MTDESRTDESRTEKIIAQIADAAALRIAEICGAMDHYRGAIAEIVAQCVTGRLINLMPGVQAENDLREIVAQAQRFQPGGSPPPGGPAVLVPWIIRRLAAERDELRAGTWADFRRVIEKYIWRRLDCDLRSNVDPKVVERNRCVLEDFFDTADRWFQEDQRRVSGDGEKGGRKNVKDQKSQDWTVGPNGTSNASEAFLGLSTAVERMIRASAADLIGGNTKAVARLIVSKLAHEHGLRPAGK